MDELISIDHLGSTMGREIEKSDEFASFGAIHLNITNLENSTLFWTRIVGMKLLRTSDRMAEFGTETQTLVVVHESANTPFQKGYSGLYHFAIHAPNKEEFASMIYRLESNNYPYSPVDHTMSQSIYLDDPDGINIEFTLETPHRFKRMITQGGFGIEDSEGNIKSASSSLDVNEVMKNLVSADTSKIISKDTSIGHIHLYANNIQTLSSFYRDAGFIPFNNLAQYMFVDFGMGGSYKHRIAMNSWHGINKPLAPKDSAGLRHFHIIFKNNEKLDQSLKNVFKFEEKDGGYWFYDPTGNNVFLTKD